MPSLARGHILSSKEQSIAFPLDKPSKLSQSKSEITLDINKILELMKELHKERPNELVD